LLLRELPGSVYIIAENFDPALIQASYRHG
jgi:hypothetical protein